MYDDENEYEDDDAPAVRLIAAGLLVNVAELRLEVKGHRHLNFVPLRQVGRAQRRGGG